MVPSATGPTNPTPSNSIVPVPPATSRPSTNPTITLSPSPIALLGPIPTGRLDTATAARLQAAVDEIVKLGAPDAIAAVITADGTWAGAAGLDGPKSRRAKPDDEFGIASVSKPFLGALVLRLVEQKKIDLDAPLATYLEGDSDANGATVRQTLAMRSGMGDTTNSAFDTTYAHCEKAWARDEILKTFSAPVGAAGTYHYSNPSYKLLGYAAEHASGTSLARAIKQLVLDPVGADRILLQGVERATPRPWALPIVGNTGPIGLADFGIGEALPCRSTATLALGSSAMASDAPSLARWGWQLLAGQVIHPDSLVTMTTFTDGQHGLGLDRLPEFGPDIALGHVGSQPGYSAVLAVLPQRRISIVVFVNDGAADVVSYGRQILNAIEG